MVKLYQNMNLYISLLDSSPDLGIPLNESQHYLTQCFVKSELENSDHGSKIYRYINLFHCYQATVTCFFFVCVCARACVFSHSKVVF